MRRENPISNDWIDAALAAGDRASAAFSPAPFLSCAEPGVFSVLSLLLRHGVIAGGVARESLVSAMVCNPEVGVSASPPNTLAGVLRFASQAAGWPVRLRSAGVRLRTDNPFTQRFKPPLAADVPNLVRHWLDSTTRVFVNNDDALHARVPWLAYAEFFTLLSIHPFADGNGRTARALYAARLAANRHAAPEWVLALALSYGENAARFHLAAQLAREGEFDDLYRNLADALTRVGPWFASEMARLQRAVAAGDADAAQAAFDTIRATLTVLMR
ncbi:MAG: Fic family protein [Xanthomonadaceae bacterium]|nr:Fic family protein [Xanthomonadaceae bacterium]MDP2184871.1 Fic family protein [Xanthomonadales bacterium]MDZ4116083.1 Fic family protein [Xanthomonadaceae bacterium]MDZ4377139.1 Fic family protein [Xanthomonadaceae bacterium]